LNLVYWLFKTEAQNLNNLLHPAKTVNRIESKNAIYNVATAKKEEQKTETKTELNQLVI